MNLLALIKQMFLASMSYNDESIKVNNFLCNPFLEQIWDGTSWVSLIKVTGLLSLCSRIICLNRRFGMSFIICHIIGKKPFHLSSFQKSMVFLKSTGPNISANPTNCPLVLTWKGNNEEHAYWNSSFFENNIHWIK